MAGAEATQAGGFAGKFVIPASMVDEIIAHSREDLPNECCGLISGHGDTAARLFRARNEFASPLRYSVHPVDLLRITGEISDAGEELVAIYHSHTRSPAWPSQTDINLAVNWPDQVYLICSLENDDDPVVNAFRLGTGEVEQLELQVV